jgi:insecticidal toxin complex protein TccC
MSGLAANIHANTPTLTVVDSRGLDVRTVAYCRAIEATEAEKRINRSARDSVGRPVKQWDPRLWALNKKDAASPANLISRYSLSGKVLGSISVDAGERISLFGDSDQPVQTWCSRDTGRRIEYDNLLRPLAVFEQGKDEAVRCTERYEYADAGADFAVHNQCGQMIRHDDPAGTQAVYEYALTGGVIEQTQRFLRALELPDWPQTLPERDALLEPVAQAATSVTCFNPLGDVLEQVDAKDNRQLFDYTVDGQLLANHLQLSGQATPLTLVRDIAYSAGGQVERETAGNGVVSTLRYSAEDGRLIQFHAARDDSVPLQDLRYDYDPVGNILSVEDAALPIRYFANQRVEPISRYDYDSLYQLTRATGWETGRVSRGPEFNRFDNPSAVANFQQTYHYDAGGNLLELVHVGPQNHSRKVSAARYSNRCLPYQDDRPPTDDQIAAAFDGNGNLLMLQPGQIMGWDLRNQLREVRPVKRESGDDCEWYFYGGDGMRRRKVRVTHTSARSLISEVRYLPGLEIRTHEGTGEVLHVICVQAGRSVMQVLHWETPPPAGIANDQFRYNLTDHLGSSSLELDSEAGVISQETYHPYGGTAWFAGRSEVEASYKTVRYSGKERDATGLYYYGFRYYVSWLQRWISPDPAGNVDGLNYFLYVLNSPVVFSDADGLVKFKPMLTLSFDSDRMDTRQRGISFSKSKLDEHGQGAKYFHGSDSSSLLAFTLGESSLTGHLLPMGKLLEEKLFPFGGEAGNALRKGAVNKEYVSTVNFDNFGGAYDYSNLNNGKQWNPEVGKVDLESHLGDLSQKEMDPDFHEAKRELLQGRLERWAALDSDSRQLVENSFAVVYGVLPDSSDAGRIIRVSSDVQGETGVRFGIASEEIRVVFTEEPHMDLVTKILRSHPPAKDVLVKAFSQVRR